jgi:hypothetical protein
VIDRVKHHEEAMGYDRHPIGMTMQFPVREQTKVNDPLFDSRAEWISPGYDDEVFAGSAHPMAPGAPPSRWLVDPPASDGRKVVITDTDHHAPGRGDALWAWKSFLRGHHPILMDFGLIGGVNPPNPSGGPMPYSAFEPARHAMGNTLRFAERMNLIEMTPRDDLSSTRYALANPGRDYLVLQPSGSREPFAVTIEPGHLRGGVVQRRRSHGRGGERDRGYRLRRYQLRRSIRSRRPSRALPEGSGERVGASGSRAIPSLGRSRGLNGLVSACRERLRRAGSA